VQGSLRFRPYPASLWRDVRGFWPDAPLSDERLFQNLGRAIRQINRDIQAARANAGTYLMPPKTRTAIASNRTRPASAMIASFRLQKSL
jgi:hypothetical protein